MVPLGRRPRKPFDQLNQKRLLLTVMMRNPLQTGAGPERTLAGGHCERECLHAHQAASNPRAFLAREMLPHTVRCSWGGYAIGATLYISPRDEFGRWKRPDRC